MILLVAVRPALRSYFFAENFIYLGQYRSNGASLWRAIWSNSDVIFFRPVFFLFSLPWHFVLPVEPFAYHVRNLAFSVVNVVLLHRLLVHLVRSAAARAIAVLFFAVSKVHFTTIGYINIYDSIVLLMLLLLTLLFLLRYVEKRRSIDYALALLFCGLSVFSKDHGLVVVVVVCAFVLTHAGSGETWRSRIQRWRSRLAPFLLLVPIYLFLRIWVVGIVVPSDRSVYSPRLSVGLPARKLLNFGTTLTNLSFRDDGTTGASGLAGALTAAFPGLRVRPSAAEGVAFAGFLLLVVLTLRKPSRPGKDLLPPVVWIAAYLGPTLLVRNIQMYYAYEAVAAASVLLGMCLERASRRLIATWSLALLLIGTNAVISNSLSHYHWQTVAKAAEQIRRPVVEAHRGEPLESITFVTSSLPLLQYALTSDFKGPMVQELLRLPDLRIRLVVPAETRTIAIESDSKNLVLDADSGFAPYEPSGDRVSLVLEAISPSRTVAGAAFNVQANGRSALGVTARNAGSGTVIMLAGKPLETAYGSPRFLTAFVPDAVLGNPGRYPIYLRDGGRESNRIEFVVDQPVGPDRANPR